MRRPPGPEDGGRVGRWAVPAREARDPAAVSRREVAVDVGVAARGLIAGDGRIVDGGGAEVDDAAAGAALNRLDTPG